MRSEWLAGLRTLHTNTILATSFSLSCWARLHSFGCDSLVPARRKRQTLSHVLADGSVKMVDVSAKRASVREARAEARMRFSRRAAKTVRAAGLKKGDALATAQIAGILAAKQTPALIPLTHAIPLSGVDVNFRWEQDVLVVQTEARTTAQTGVEMEALVAAAIAALTVYDMTKSLERGTSIQRLSLIEKSGGKSGSWKVPH